MKELNKKSSESRNINNEMWKSFEEINWRNEAVAKRNSNLRETTKRATGTKLIEKNFLSFLGTTSNL